MTYRLLRKNYNDDRGWLSCTKGDIEYILEVLRLNLESEVLKEFNWKIERVD